jgi:hypothetical protein
MQHRGRDGLIVEVQGVENFGYSMDVVVTWVAGVAHLSMVEIYGVLKSFPEYLLLIWWQVKQESVDNVSGLVFYHVIFPDFTV